MSIKPMIDLEGFARVRLYFAGAGPSAVQNPSSPSWDISLNFKLYGGGLTICGVKLGWSITRTTSSQPTHITYTLGIWPIL
jgi:hypothetical protein